MEVISIISPKEIHKCAAEHGWWEKERSIPECLCLVHSEISEALEAFREEDWANFGEELADTVIRIFDLCAYLGVDIAAEVEEKHLVNLRRPYRHGGKKC